MLVNIKVTGGWNIESGQIDPKATQGLSHIRNIFLFTSLPSFIWDFVWDQSSKISFIVFSVQNSLFVFPCWAPAKEW